MKKALVLGGGGSKGAYEIGVWKALNELDMKFDIVTGTSIGALIGVLVVQDDYEKALQLWEHLSVEDVMVNGVNMDMDIELIMSQKGKYIDFLSSYLHHKGADISPFVEIVKNMYDPKKFFESKLDYGCMTVNFSKHCAQPMLKKDMSEIDVVDYIIASASCFPAFPMKIINDEKFIDGGY
ncbi:MAG: patatin-like phospholipase family protein, partial [Longicatena sp.]